MSERKLNFRFTRMQVCHLLDALEGTVESFKYDGGLILAEDYIRLENYFRERLGAYDRIERASREAGGGA